MPYNKRDGSRRHRRRRILHEIPQLYLEQGSDLIAESRNAIKVRDSARITEAVHTRRGTIPFYHVTPLADALDTLRAFVMVGTLDDCRHSYTPIENEFERRKSHLRRW